MSKSGTFSRRRFLRGAGTVLVGLPMLDVFARSPAGAQDMKRRFAVFIRQGNGVAQAGNGEPERFWPKALGALTTAGMQAETDRAVVELASYANKLLLVRGTKFAFPGNGCGHSGGGNQVLTAQKVSSDPSGAKSLAMGESVDTRMAREINPQGRDPLTLLTGATQGYLPVVLSYRGAKMLRGADNDPFVVYKRMTGLAGMDAGVVQQIASRRKSVNDLIRGQLNDFLGRTDLSGDDRKRLDLHLSSIRDVEVRMGCTLADMRQRELDAVNPTDGKNYVQVTQMHMDLVALSFACDYSRVATIQMGQGNDATQFSIPGFRNGETLPRFHQISHRIYSDGAEGDPIEGAQEMHHQIDKLHARLFKYLLDKLASYSTPEGTLLDSGVAAWTNDLGHGVSHNYQNIPWVLAGSAGGFLKQGQYIDAGNVTHNKLFNTLLTAVGVRKADGSPVDDFGDPSLAKGLIESMKA
ncbi:MAG TPA: DUF1552 domain-containing protein [Polyangiales bacterium]|nr:DUF1552 domain-containing protein [Polyangiales bacterium]